MPRIPLLSALLLAAVLSSAARSKEPPVSFRREIAPLLLEKCVACHSEKKGEGGLRLDSFAHLMGEGDSGPAITAGDPGASEAFVRIVSDKASERMPAEGPPLAEEEIARWERWIEEGARFDGDDPTATLASLIPRPPYPAPPEVYPRPVPVTALAFLNESELAVSGYHEITIWDAAGGELLRRWPGMPPSLLALRLTADGERLIAAGGTPGRSGEARVLSLVEGETLALLPAGDDVAWDAAPAPSGDRLAVAGADARVRIFQLPEGALLQTLRNHSDWVRAVAWSPDGKRLATAGRDGTAKVVSLASGQVVCSYSGHGRPVTGVLFLNGGKEVLSSGHDGKAHRWSAANAKRIGNPGSAGGEAYTLLGAGESTFLGGSEKRVMQWRPGDEKSLRMFTGAEDWVLSLALSPQGEWLAAGTHGGEVLVWRVADGQLRSRFFAAPGLGAPP